MITFKRICLLFMNISEAIQRWIHGPQINLTEDVLYGIPFFWVERIAKVLQFSGGLTIIADILGKDRVVEYKEKMEKFVDMQSFIKSVVRNAKALWFTISMAFINNPLDDFARKIAKEKLPKIDLTFLLQHRKEFETWRIDNQFFYNRWKSLKNKAKFRSKFPFDIFAVALGFAIIDGLFLSFFLDSKVGIFGIIGVLVCVMLLSKITKNIFIVILMIPLIGITFLVLGALTMVFILFKIITLFVLELFIFKPAILYLKISVKGKALQMISFIFILLGFVIDMLCS